MGDRAGVGWKQIRKTSSARKKHKTYDKDSVREKTKLRNIRERCSHFRKGGEESPLWR